MPNMPNDFWSGWIVLITVLSLAALAWVVVSIYFTSDSKPDKAGEREPVWDGDLTEGNQPPPLWWFWLILAMMVLSVFYLMLYPGLGSFKGALGWSQDSRVAGSYQKFNQSFDEVRGAILQSDMQALQNNEVYMGSARGIFSRNCAACHGEQAQGQANLFPNLTDEQWQWGGSAANIEQTIRQGRMAVMAAWQQTLGGEGVDQVTDYVLALAQGESSLSDHPGHTSFQQYCVACHGAEGKGNTLLGAPNLSDSDWLYGGSRETIKKTVAFGRNGVIPSFEERLDDVQIKLLVAWLTR